MSDVQSLHDMIMEITTENANLHTANIRLRESNAELLAALEALMENKTCSPLKMTPDERGKLWASFDKARAAIFNARSVK